jgi:hypothetical protein
MLRWEPQIAQIGVVSLAELRLQPTIEARPRKTRDFDEVRDAGRIRVGFALRSFARHGFDDGEQAGASLTRRFSSHDRLDSSRSTAGPASHKPCENGA